MTIERITRPTQVLENWEIFDEGFQHLQELVKLHYFEPQAKKMLCQYAGDNVHHYITLVLDDTKPAAFAVAHETTLPFANRRTFEIYAIYYRPGYSSVLVDLMKEFEDWCRFNNVRRYTVLTRRATTAAKRCFQHEKYGFKRMAFVFEKDIL